MSTTRVTVIGSKFHHLESDDNAFTLCGRLAYQIVSKFHQFKLVCPACLRERKVIKDEH